MGPSYTVEVLRHHIIPFNVLRNFYNRVSDNNRLTNLSRFLNTYSDNLRFFASSNGIDCSRLGNDLFNAGNLAQGQSTGWTTSGGRGMPFGFDTFEQFYAWLPGNLFIGPNNRSDDPIEGFENNAHVIVRTATFDVLFRLNDNMNRYIATNDAYLLNSISSDLSGISGRRSIYELKAGDWDFKNGKYSIKPSGKVVCSIPDIKLNDTCESYKPNLRNKIFSAIYSRENSIAH